MVLTAVGGAYQREDGVVVVELLLLSSFKGCVLP